MTTQTTTHPTEATCPPWCTGHPALEPEWHQGTIEVPGVAAGVTIQSKVGVDPVLSIEVGDMNAGQAHELGMALVRAADRIRRETTR